MAASRLSDSQKQELVQRYRQGESSAELAAAYGCSPNTVSRTVKAAVDPAEYEQLKQQQRGKASELPAPVVTASAPEPEPNPAPQPKASDANQAGAGGGDAGVLAIDDADDFGDDDVDSGLSDDDLGDDDFGDDDLGIDDDIFTPVAVLPIAINHEPAQAQPLVAEVLPESLYLLVDKTVELQPKPLRDFPELGALSPDQEELQALQLFANPRQAKRQCGRSQRVIKMPDPAVLVRRASYLQVKGISRLVVEGTLYALPEG